MRMSRRHALSLFGLSAAVPTIARAAAYTGTVSFKHGVASGDPLADRVILWTRITPEAAGADSIAYSWKLTPMDRRAGGAKSGSGVTDASRDPIPMNSPPMASPRPWAAPAPCPPAR